MKHLLFPLACLSLVGCATTQNVTMSQEALASMQGKSLVLIQRESPNFVAMTSGKGMFAVAGVGAAAAAGNKLVEEQSIKDPAMNISQSVARELTQSHGLILQNRPTAVESAEAKEIAASASGSDYALDVVTNGWSYIYDGFNFGDYFVGYSSKLRLIDVKAAEIVSSGSCFYDAKKAGKSAVTHDALLADNAAYIKQELADAADLCIKEFGTNLF